MFDKEMFHQDELALRAMRREVADPKCPRCGYEGQPIHRNPPGRVDIVHCPECLYFDLYRF